MPGDYQNLTGYQTGCFKNSLTENPENQKSTVVLPADLQIDRMPKHIAIILDGNGRWAQARGLSRSRGHEAGAEALKKIVRCSREIGLQVLTVYAFSTENWKRPAEEVNFIMNLLVSQVKTELQELVTNGVKLRILGRVDELPLKVRQAVTYACEQSRDNNRLILNIALNYGSRAEITDAVKALYADLLAGDWQPEDINEQLLEKYFYTAGLPDPDLLIRPSGELRLSNFLLWQLAYAELWLTEKYWPDFTGEDLVQAIADYQKRDRRFGGLSKQPKE